MPEALRARRDELDRRPCEPVAVAWAGEPAALALRARSGPGPARCTLLLEGGGERRWTADLAAGEREVPLPGGLPPGYHRLSVETGGRACEALVISAPTRAYTGGPGRAWGVFLPLHALRSGRSWGVGDFTDLGDLAQWAGGLGASVVATLPLLACFLDEPFDPSPYSPASRLFLNELHVDPASSPEWEACPEARELAASPGFRAELAALSGGDLVDHRRAMALKRRVLELLARHALEGPPVRREALLKAAEERPALGDYARFRAACDRHRAGWRAWPAPERDGSLPDDPAAGYHLYAQWLAGEQLGKVSRQAGLLLDFPLGVNGLSFDVWRHRDLFVTGTSAGAPPDALNHLGQDWGFSPLHPERLREDGYRYQAEALRTLLRHAAVLRIDHVMGFHRLFVVPRGADASQGVYVRYPTEELYAVLSLESHRSGTLIVGEDLGTVPGYVRRAMARHAVHRTYVLQYQLRPDPARALSPVPAGAMASVNTHDQPPFAAFWTGADLEERVALGLLEESEIGRERAGRAALREALCAQLRSGGWLEGTPPAGDVLRGCLAYLAASRARVVTVNLEDLWGETHSQNVPGTYEEHPNWRRRARCSLEELGEMPSVVGRLREVGRLRAGPAGR